MKSVKPSRGSSLEHGIAGLVAVVVGIVWLSHAVKRDAPTSMLLFGGLFILIGVLNAFLGFYNAKASNRLSSYDIVEDEPDIFEKKLGNHTTKEGSEKQYCPYCGTKVDENAQFCSKCGKQL